MLFYLLTLAESVEFIDQEVSKGWYAGAIFMLALTLVVELLLLWNQYTTLYESSCPPSLEFSDIYGELFNDAIKSSFGVRGWACVGVTICYVGSRIWPGGCMGDCCDDGKRKYPSGQEGHEMTGPPPSTEGSSEGAQERDGAPNDGMKSESV